MSKQTDRKACTAVLGAGFVVSLAASPLAGAADNPFEIAQFERGYGVAAEGACGAHDTQAEGAAGDKSSEGKCGAADDAGDEKSSEGKCGS